MTFKDSIYLRRGVHRATTLVVAIGATIVLLILPLHVLNAQAKKTAPTRKTTQAKKTVPVKKQAPKAAAPKPAAAGNAAVVTTRADTPTPFNQTLPGSVVKVKMAGVPSGTITIAGKQVEIKPFWIATTETPWEAFDAFIASGEPSKPYDMTEFPADAIARPSKSYILPDLGWGHAGRPAINVSFLSATMYCRWLAKETGKKYRLPTEAEWEYACRAGVSGGAKLTPQLANKVSWNASNSDGITQPVGKKQANKWGLFDTLGNTGEWATDMDGKMVLCGPTFKDPATAMSPGVRKRFTPKWQETDPQLPKSRWWLSDAPFCGFRVICEQ